MDQTKNPVSAKPPASESDFSNLELPDTPVNRLISQDDPEPAPTGDSRMLFTSIAEAPSVVESVVDRINELKSGSMQQFPSRPGAPFFFFGIGIPFSAILLELVSRICAETFFDPMPTVWHTVLVCAVPLANLLVWRELRQEDAAYSPWLAAINGLAVGVSAFYALVFLPLVPFSLIGLILLGLGILGLSPQLAFATSIRGAILLHRLKQSLSGLTEKRQPSFTLSLIGGLCLSLSVLVGLEINTTLTRLNLRRAVSGKPATSVSGVRWLRSFGSEDVMLKACYSTPAGVTDLIGSLLSLSNPVKQADAQTAFYRVTGKPFNSLPKPKKAGNGRFDLLDFDNRFDANRGSERVGGVIQGLVLASSRIDGSLDADAALGYFEWTMVFKNETFSQQEARAQIQLPPGGVVSRLTLWVNGEEREAAFASRGKVQAAYQQVVTARRDPVLITSNGSDQIMVQCFPVPPSGEMKIRFGVTAPIALESKQQGWLRLPLVADRNFAVENLNHAIWFESKRQLRTTNQALLAEHSENSLFAVRGTLTDSEMISSNAAIRVERAATGNQSSEFWTPDPKSKPFEAIHQRIEERDWPQPQRVVLLVDGSVGMQQHLPTIADAIRRLPDGIELVAIVASDETNELSGTAEKGSPKFYDFVSENIRRIKAEGGSDNLAALIRAWDFAAQNPSSTILWIHEPKPVLLGSTDELQQRWERRPDSPQLFDLQTTAGPNRIAEKLDGITAVQTVTRTGSLAQDLDRLMARWRGESKEVVIYRERIERKNQGLRGDLQETSSHLARLWAFDETRRLLASKTDANRDKAIKLAASYQLVTPATGAVVLETAEQYQRAGLEPVPQNSVPTIPEPEEWALMIVAALVVLWMTIGRKFARRFAW